MTGKCTLGRTFPAVSAIATLGNRSESLPGWSYHQIYCPPRRAPLFWSILCYTPTWVPLETLLLLETLQSIFLIVFLCSPSMGVKSKFPPPPVVQPRDFNHSCEHHQSRLPPLCFWREFLIVQNAGTHWSFIKDTTHFVSKLEQLGQLADNAILATLDVSSFYTNIPHNEGIDACRHFLDTRIRNPSTISTETLCDLIRMIPTKNNFTFNDKHYSNTRHCHGNQNGTFLCKSVFCQVWNRRSFTCPLPQPHTWWRCIDDIFMTWTHSVDDLQTFTTQQHSPHHQIYMYYSFTSVPFLDVNVSLIKGKITTDLYTKTYRPTSILTTFFMSASTH